MAPLTFAFPILLFSCLFALIHSSPKLPYSKLLLTQPLERQGDTGGLSFEECSSSGDCKDPRFCYLFSDPESLCTGAGACVCLPVSQRECSSHIHCVEGEVCAEIQGFGTVCAAESFVADNPDAQRLPGEKPPLPPFPSGEGLTLDPCTSTGSCADPRFCNEVLDPDSICSGANTCHCQPLRMISCSSSRDCVKGETCASVPDFGTVCASESFVRHISANIMEEPSNPTKPAPSGTTGSSDVDSSDVDSSDVGSSDVGSSGVGSSGVGSSGVGSSDGEQQEENQSGSSSEQGSVCISVEFLDHLSRDALRFEIDNLASVLCDENGSCATPGHIVKFHREPMMMNSYCQRTKCTRKVMKVNSPKYRRRMDIPSRTSGLTFTVLAARYGTLAEEKVLNAVVRMGF